MLMLNEYVVVPKRRVEKNGARHRDKDGRMTLLQYVVRNRNRT